MVLLRLIQHFTSSWNNVLFVNLALSLMQASSKNYFELQMIQNVLLVYLLLFYLTWSARYVYILQGL